MTAIETGIGLDIVVFFHAWYQPLTAWLFTSMHVLGGEKGFLILLPIIFWAIDKQLGIRLFLLIMCNAVLMNILKLVFARPRPFEVAPNLFESTVHQGGFGLPSGHVWLSVILVGFLAYTYKSKPVIMLAVAWIVFMGVSRMVLGVHFPQDVLLGWALGVIGLVTFIKWYPLWFKWFLSKTVLTQVLYMVVLLLLIQLIAVMLHEAFEYRKSLLSASGVLVGGGLGLVLAKRFACFDVNGSILNKIARVVLGLILLILLYVLMSWLFYQVFTNTQALSANLVYQLRYVCLGIWVTFIIPWILSKCHLVKLEQDND